MRNAFVYIAIVLYAVLMTVVWNVQTHVVYSRVATSAADGVVQILANLEHQIEPELCRLAQEFVRKWGTVETAAKADIPAVARQYHLDRICIVGTNNLVLAASLPTVLGFDFAAHEETREYLRLNQGAHFVTQPFRRSVDDKSLPFMKFVGISFPDGGFIQVADSIRFDDLYWRDYVFAQCMRDEYASDGGYYALVDPVRKIVVSTLTRENSGKCAEEAGFMSLDFGSGDGPVRGRIFGEPSLVWRTRPEFINAVGYVVFPLKGLMRGRNISVLAVAAAIFIVLTIGCLFFWKISRQSLRLRAQNRKMEQFYLKEEKARHRDMSLAKSIQLSALPSVFPPFPGRKEFDIYATMRTARDVGGDFYDFYFVAPSKLCMLVADVSGKGIPAAMCMMRSRTLLKASMTSAPDLAAAVALTNERLCENNAAEMFVTAWVGVFDVETGELRFVSAGHNPPFVCHPGGEVEMLKVKPALVLGAMTGVSYSEGCVRLRPGDRLLLYTDGVTEATSADGNLFGENRLEAALREVSGDVVSCCDHIIRAVDDFVGEAPQADDITMLAFDYKGLVGTHTRTFPASIEGLAHATQFLQRRLGAVECAEKTKSSLMVAFDEIASNVVRYSGAPDFTVQVSTEDEYARIIVSDSGKAFNPLAQEDPNVTLSADERAIGGLGLFMVKRMMDEVKYDRIDGRNILTLGKIRV